MVCQYSFPVPSGVSAGWPTDGIRIISATYIDQNTGSGTFFDVSALPECFDDACVSSNMETIFPAQEGTQWNSDISAGTIGGAVVYENLVSLDVTSSGSQYQLSANTGSCFNTGSVSVPAQSNANAIFTWDELSDQAYMESTITFFAVFVSFFIGLMRKI